MEEIKVGEYVRTKYGYIAKITEIDNYIWFNQKINKESGMAVYELSKVEFENLVVNHSPNIIDLIEEGDYVNGDKIVAIDYTEDEDGNYKNVLGIMEIEDDYAYPIELRVLNIKTIVTKEQYAAIEYKVEE